MMGVLAELVCVAMLQKSGVRLQCETRIIMGYSNVVRWNGMGEVT